MDTFDYSTTESAYDYSTMEYTGTADYWSTMDADESLYTTVAPLEDVFDFRTWLFNSLMQVRPRCLLESPSVICMIFLIQKII